MKCPVAARCGGCLGPHLSYRDHLAQKQREMNALLGRFCPVDPILGMEDPYHYRNKSITTFAQDRSGKLVSGIYAQGSHRVIPVEDCCLQMELLNRTQAAVLAAARRCRLPAYEEDRGQGLLRHCLVRCDSGSQKALVTLVTPSAYFPGSRNFCKELTKLAPWVTGVVQSINPRATSAVLGKTFKTLWGKPFLEDTLLGQRFALSPGSFYQVNARQTPRLYRTALDFAALDGAQQVLDAYCGIGTIGLCAAPRARQVIGVELNPEAARDAAANARRNGAENARFFQGDATAWMEEQARRGSSPQVVILDPPRAGTTPRFIAAVQAMGPDRVVYVSCDPQTLARDLALFVRAGYRPVKCRPVDMFPFTPHVETVVLLSHKKPDGHINVKVEFGEGEGKVPLDNIAKRAEAYKPKERVTYKMIKEYIEAKYGFKVHTAYIAEVKRSLGLPMYDAPNAVEELKQPRKHPTAEKVEAIKDALKHFEVV